MAEPDEPDPIPPQVVPVRPPTPDIPPLDHDPALLPPHLRRRAGPATRRLARERRGQPLETDVPPGGGR